MVKHIVLQIPKLLGKVHVVRVRIFETEYLVPHCGDLALAMLSHLSKVGEVVNQLTLFEDRLEMFVHLVDLLEKKLILKLDNQFKV